jgi:hypothetical protein
VSQRTFTVAIGSADSICPKLQRIGTQRFRHVNEFLSASGWGTSLLDHPRLNMKVFARVRKTFWYQSSSQKHQSAGLAPYCWPRSVLMRWFQTQLDELQDLQVGDHIDKWYTLRKGLVAHHFTWCKNLNCFHTT